MRCCTTFLVSTDTLIPILVLYIVSERPPESILEPVNVPEYFNSNLQPKLYNQELKSENVSEHILTLFFSLSKFLANQSWVTSLMFYLFLVNNPQNHRYKLLSLKDIAMAR